MPTEKEAAEVFEKKTYVKLFLIDCFCLFKKGRDFLGRLMFILSGFLYW